MPILREHDAVQHRVPGSTFHSFAAPATGSSELCAWRLEVAPGTQGAAHRVTREELFLVLAGDLTVTLNGDTTRLTAGEVVLVSSGAELCVSNTSARPATAWVTTTVGFQATTADGATITPPWVR
jgi:quercetin dioxygenase-like cupin family protein